VQRGAKARPTQHEPRSRRIEGSLCTTRPGSARLRRGLTADRSRAEDIVQRHSWAPGAMLRNCWRTNVQCQPGLSTSYVTFSSTPPEPRVPDQSRPTSTTTQSRQSTEALISSWTRQFCSTPCNDYPQHGLTDFGCSTVCSQASHSSSMWARTAPTRRLTAAGLGKIPTTRERRLISLLIRSSGSVDEVSGDAPWGKVVNAKTFAMALSSLTRSSGNDAHSGRDLVPGR
jgi:hypothetical protein